MADSQEQLDLDTADRVTDDQVGNGSSDTASRSSSLPWWCSASW
jgi:hypothetical protein